MLQGFDLERFFIGTSDRKVMFSVPLVCQQDGRKTTGPTLKILVEDRCGHSSWADPGTGFLPSLMLAESYKWRQLNHQYFRGG